MADSRSVMQEFRFLDQKRQAGALTPAEAGPPRRAPRPGRLRAAGARPWRLRRHRGRGPAPRVAAPGRPAQPAHSSATHSTSAAPRTPGAPTTPPGPPAEPEPPLADRPLLRPGHPGAGGPAAGLEPRGPRLRSRRALRRGGLDRGRLRPQRHLRLVGARRGRAAGPPTAVGDLVLDPEPAEEFDAPPAEPPPLQFGEYDAPGAPASRWASRSSRPSRRWPPSRTAAGSTTPGPSPAAAASPGAPRLRRVRRVAPGRAGAGRAR